MPCISESFFRTGQWFAVILVCGLDNPPAKQYDGRTILGWEMFKGVLCAAKWEVSDSAGSASCNESMLQARADVNPEILVVGSEQRCKALYARAEVVIQISWPWSIWGNCILPG